MILIEDIEELDPFALGQRIQDARIHKGIKALDLAEILDISKDQYSRIENGRSVCSTKLLYQISQYLEVSADYLLFGREYEDIWRQITIVLDGRSKSELERARRVLEAVFR